MRRRRPQRPQRQPPSLIFVDIDGVLNSTRWFLSTCGDPKGESIPANRPDLRLDPDCIRRLAQLERALGASLVLSSNWRRTMRYRDFADLCFAVAGTRPNFVGQTLVFGLPVPSTRREEIWNYARHTGTARSFLVLDDMILGMREQLWINPDYGLTDEHVREAIGRFA